MTTLTITPNWKNKTARFKGVIAAGEHVVVNILGGEIGEDGLANLRLRVLGPCGATFAQFPFWTEENRDKWPEGVTEPDSWEGGDSLSCELNLNTVQMLRAVPPAATVPLLFVLDDAEDRTLYFKDLCDVTHWPQRVGEDTPVDLGMYVDLMKYVNIWHTEHQIGMQTIEKLEASAFSGSWAFWPASEGGDGKWHRVLISTVNGHGCLSFERDGREYRSLTDRFEVDKGVLYAGSVFRRPVSNGVLYLGAVA